MAVGKLYYTVGIRKRWWARVILLCSPVLRHLPIIRGLAVWTLRRGIFLNGERSDRVRDRLDLNRNP